MSDHAEFGAFARRILRAMGRRVGSADPEDLVDLLTLRAEVDAAVDHAIAGMRARGVSWTEIAAPLGVSRQAARQRWGDNAKLSENSTARRA